MTSQSDQPGFSRLFTLEEARQLLPELIRALGEVRDLRAHIATAIADLEQILPSRRQNGEATRAAQLEGQIESEIRRLDGVVESIMSQGVELKDAEHGIVDFPHERDGRIVYLCYRLGEPDVSFWHEIGDGFAGRQPL
jgi:hypothetical protein